MRSIITWRCWRQPELGPRITGYTWPQRFQSLPGTTPIFLVILIIFLSMYFGWATPTEAGALGAFSVFAFALKNGIKRGELRQCLLDSAKLTVMIFTVIWGVLIFVRFLGFSGMPEEIARWVTEPRPAADRGPARDLPAVFRARHGARGHRHVPADPAGRLPGDRRRWATTRSGSASCWSSSRGIASLSPPVGLVVFVVNGVRPDISVRDIFKGVWPFIFADIITLGVLTAFPEIVTFIVESTD